MKICAKCGYSSPIVQCTGGVALCNICDPLRHQFINSRGSCAWCGKSQKEHKRRRGAGRISSGEEGNLLRRVLIESPYAGRGPWPLNVLRRGRNIWYARRCMLDSLCRGEAPILSHLLYPQVLDDNNSRERAKGILAGLAWGAGAEATVVYVDRGISMGMECWGIADAEQAGRPIEYRSLRKGWGGSGRDASSRG